jgi:hypothetical protein
MYFADLLCLGRGRRIMTEHHIFGIYIALLALAVISFILLVSWFVGAMGRRSEGKQEEREWNRINHKLIEMGLADYLQQV